MGLIDGDPSVLRNWKGGGWRGGGGRLNPLSWLLRGLCKQEVAGVALPLSAVGRCRAVCVEGDCLGYTNSLALLLRRPAVLGLRWAGLRHQRPPAPLRAGGFGTRLWVSRLGWAKGFLLEPCWGADGARPLQRERLWEGGALTSCLVWECSALPGPSAASVRGARGRAVCDPRW